MGIQGLLRALRPITRPTTVGEFRGQTAVIDAFAWLHRASYCCALELVLNLRPTTRYLNFCMDMIEMLENFGVTPIVVFDGANLPMKLAEEQSRKRSREQNRVRAAEALDVNDIHSAVKYCQRAVRVTQVMVRAFIEALRTRGTQFVVAPYEADSQMAYMVTSGLADVAITEDSDLLAFGATKVIYKLNKHGGCEFIDLGAIHHYEPPPLLSRAPSSSTFSERDTPSASQAQTSTNASGSIKKVKDFCRTLKAFKGRNFLHMCILSGCDYLPSLPNIGLLTAQKLIRENRDIDRVFYFMKRGKRKVQITKEYEVKFRRAELTFLHQRVFDPRSQSVVHLTPLPAGFQVSGLTLEDDDRGASLDFLGPPIADSLAAQLADGQLNPKTLDTWGPEVPIVRWKKSRRGGQQSFGGGAGSGGGRWNSGSAGGASFPSSQRSSQADRPNPFKMSRASSQTSKSHERRSLDSLSSSSGVGRSQPARNRRATNFDISSILRVVQHKSRDSPSLPPPKALESADERKLSFRDLLRRGATPSSSSSAPTTGEGEGEDGEDEDDDVLDELERLQESIFEEDEDGGGFGAPSPLSSSSYSFARSSSSSSRKRSGSFSSAGFRPSSNAFAAPAGKRPRTPFSQSKSHSDIFSGSATFASRSSLTDASPHSQSSNSTGSLQSQDIVYKTSSTSSHSISERGVGSSSSFSNAFATPRNPLDKASANNASYDKAPIVSSNASPSTSSASAHETNAKTKRKCPFKVLSSKPERSDDEDDMSDGSDMSEVDEDASLEEVDEDGPPGEVTKNGSPQDEKSSVDPTSGESSQLTSATSPASEDATDRRPLKKRKCAAESPIVVAEVAARRVPLDWKVSARRSETIDLCDDDDDDDDNDGEGALASDAKENALSTPKAPRRFQTATKNAKFSSQGKGAKFSGRLKAERRGSSGKSARAKKRKRSGQTLFSMGFVSK